MVSIIIVVVVDGRGGTMVIMVVIGIVGAVVTGVVICVVVYVVVVVVEDWGAWVVHVFCGVGLLVFCFPDRQAESGKQGKQGLLLCGLWFRCYKNDLIQASCRIRFTVGHRFPTATCKILLSPTIGKKYCRTK